MDAVDLQCFLLSQCSQLIMLMLLFPLFTSVNKPCNPRH